MRRDAGEDLDLLVQADGAHLLHPLLELGDVEDALGLHEVGAGLDLLLEAQGAELERVAERVLGAADVELRRDRHLVAALELGLVAHVLVHLDQVDGVEVVHALGLGVVAEAHVVAGEAEDVLDAEHRGAEDVGLHGQAVTVAAGHLHDRLEAVLLGLDSPRPWSRRGPRRSGCR